MLCPAPRAPTLTQVGPPFPGIAQLRVLGDLTQSMLILVCYAAVYKQAIIATDYATYALYMACRPEFDATTKTFGRSLYAEVWARQGVTLSKDTIDTLTSVLGSYDVDPASIKIMDSKC